MATSRFEIAKPDIVRFFDMLPKKVLRQREIARILTEQRAGWRLAVSTTLRQFLELMAPLGLRAVRFSLPYRPETRYVWQDVPLLEIVQTLRQNAYFTHATAMRLLGLTEQVPKTIYLNHEQPDHSRSDEPLQQTAVDNAFRAPQRVSKNVVQVEGVQICVVNGMWTGSLGVQSRKANYDSTEPVFVRSTDIERTLIDITVRPIYAGGVTEVAKAFEIARPDVSTTRLLSYLDKLDYAYPYHQAIGYYMQRAGYSEKQLTALRKMQRTIDFYLTHRMGATDYVSDWRLFIPKGF